MILLALILIICYADLINSELKAEREWLDGIRAEMQREIDKRENLRNSRKNALLLLRAVQRDIKLGHYHWGRMKAVVDSFYPEVK